MREGFLGLAFFVGNPNTKGTLRLPPENGACFPEGNSLGYLYLFKLRSKRNPKVKSLALDK